MSAAATQQATSHCPFCRCSTRSTLGCPQCAAPVHPACAWELGRCAACNSPALLDLLAAARLGSTPSADAPSWDVGSGWAAAISWTAPLAVMPLDPRLQLTLEPPSLQSLWVCGQVTLQLPRPLWARELRLSCSGDARARLRLLPAGELMAGTWLAAFRVRRASGAQPLDLRVELRAGRGFRRVRLRAGLRVGALVGD